MFEKEILCGFCKEKIVARRANTKYCNARCRQKHHLKKFKNESIRYEIKLRRQEVLNIKGRKCHFCKSNKQIVVHHINYKSNDLSNLIIICLSCHQKLHIILDKSK